MIIGVVGGNGKLGSIICNTITETGDKAVIIESTNELWNSKGKVDVYIDCTSVNAFMQNYNMYELIKKPLVIATTGFSEEQSEYIPRLSKTMPIIKAANFSIGVYKYLKIIEYATKLLGDEYEIGIVEKHHKYKKDKPSGTANEMAKVVHEVLPNKKLAIESIRLFDYVGEHSIYFHSGGGEDIEFTHKITNRQSFATGAVTAAKWIYNKPNGIYSMKDMLGF